MFLLRLANKTTKETAKQIKQIQLSKTGQIDQTKRISQKKQKLLTEKINSNDFGFLRNRRDKSLLRLRQQ